MREGYLDVMPQMPPSRWTPALWGSLWTWTPAICESPLPLPPPPPVTTWAAAGRLGDKWRQETGRRKIDSRGILRESPLPLLPPPPVWAAVAGHHTSSCRRPQREITTGMPLAKLIRETPQGLRCSHVDESSGLDWDWTGFWLDLDTGRVRPSTNPRLIPD
jgi:hypothetical protein